MHDAKRCIIRSNIFWLIACIVNKLSNHFQFGWLRRQVCKMGVKGEIQEFLESSTIHGLAHIATGRSIYARIIWVLIVIACFSIGISLIDKAFYSWATTPIITTVDTRPISEVIFPEITVCPPSGTDTALNMDLEATKGMELSEEQREELILEMVENLHNEHIVNLAEEQSLFFPLDRIRKAYSGEHKFSLGFSSPGYTYDGATYPDTVKLTVEVESKGALEGEFSTPSYGDPVTGPEGWPSAEFSYKAKLIPQIYDFSLNGANLVIELNYNTEVSPSGYGTFTDSEAYEQIQLETITQDNTFIQKTGPGNSTLSYALDISEDYDFYYSPTRYCSFSLNFQRSLVLQNEGAPQNGMSLRWHVEDDTGRRISEVDLDMEMENVTWCQDSDSDYSAYSSDTEELEGGLLVRWFNILHHFIIVVGMDLTGVWSIVRQMKTNRLWKEKADCVMDTYSWPPAPMSYLKHEGIETLLNDIDEGGVIDGEVRLSPGDLSDELWKAGFAMFLHLAYCPDPLTETWAQFYEQTLADSPVRSIVEKLGAVTRSKTDSGVLTTEVALFSGLRRMIPFKVGSAALALSTAEQLQESLHLPMLAPMRPTILSCLNEGSCEDLEKEVEKLTRNDLSQANQPAHIINAEGNLSSSAFIPFCAFAGDMSVVGSPVEGFSLPVCTIFQPRDVEGQLCFSTNLSSIEKLPSPDQGSNKGELQAMIGRHPFICTGLTLAIDYNSERGIHTGPTVHMLRSVLDCIKGIPKMISQKREI